MRIDRIDGDGTNDVVFSVCDKDSCQIRVLYNVQDPLCDSHPEVSCRKVKNLCEGDDAFSFQYTEEVALSFVFSEIN